MLHVFVLALERVLDVVVCGWTPSFVRLRAYAVVVPASVVGQVHSLKVFGVPRVELLRHILVVNLVKNDVEFVEFGQDTHLKLASPDALPADMLDIVVNVHVSIDVEPVLVFVLGQVICHLPSEVFVFPLAAVDLVSHSPEEAIAIRFDLLEPETLLGEGNLELCEVKSLLSHDCSRAIILDLPEIVFDRVWVFRNLIDSCVDHESLALFFLWHFVLLLCGW